MRLQDDRLENRFGGGYLRGAQMLTLTLMACIAPTVMAAPRDLTPYDVARLRTVSAAVISPDGSKIAYTLSVPRQPWLDNDDPADKDGGTWSELHIVDVDGHTRPFITGQVSVAGVKWKPDGTGVSFLSKRGTDKNRSLYVIPIDGGEARCVLKHDTDIATYDWSPDGKQVSFIAQEKVDKKVKKKKDLGFTQEIYEEDERDSKVWIATIDDKDKKPRMLETEGTASVVAWSPAGGELAVAVAPTPLIDDEYMKRKVHLIDPESGKVSARLANPGKLGPISWSPDGKHLAILSANDINDPSDGCLLVSSAEGGSLKNVLPDFPGHVSTIAWQSASHVMYVAGVGLWTQFGKVAADAADSKVLVAPENKFVLDGLTVSKDGQAAAMIGQSAEHPGEVFFMKHGDATPRRLTHSNPWLKDIRMPKQEVVEYKARDGLMIEGILIRPLDEKPGQRYPLVLVVHGGPEAHYSAGWLTRYANPGYVWAAKGYAVFYPNYRSSTGRGVAFSKAGQGDCGGKEFDDLIDGVDYLIEKGLVDKAKVGVTGGSYGGFATAWCSTYYSDRFAAGVMFVGISDLISKAGTTDIANEMKLVHELKWPWDNWQEFEERSPIRHVQKCKTPLLIMHGKDDPRVHPSQSMQLYRFLKILNQAPVRYVRYPGEGHGNRKAAAQLDFQLRLIQWMDHYLKGTGGAAPDYELKYSEKEDEEKEDGKKKEEEKKEDANGEAVGHNFKKTGVPSGVDSAWHVLQPARR